MAGGQPVAGLYVELRALVAKFQQDMDGATKAVLGAEKKITGAFNTIQKVGQAALVLGGVVAIKKLADGISELAQKGEVAGSIAEGFQKLGGSAKQIEQAQKAVLGMVDSFDLMQVANSGLLKEIPGFNENFSKIADLGGRLANTLGTDTKGAIQEVTDALAQAKEKQLQAVGITIDAEKAYRDYAAQIGVTAKQLDDAQKKEARQIAAIEALDGALGRLAPVTDSVANAQQAFQTALGEGVKKMGIAINSNESLTKAWRNLEEQIYKIDWNQIGEDIGDLAAMVMNVFADAIPAIQAFFHEFVLGAKVVQRALLEIQANGKGLGDAFDTAINEVAKSEAIEASIKNLQGIKGGVEDLTKKLGEAKSQAEVAELADEMLALSEAAQKANVMNVPLGESVKQVTELFNKQMEVLPETTKVTIKHGQKSTEALESEAKAASHAADEIDKLKQKWAEFAQKSQEDSLKTQLEEAVKTLDQANFDGLKQRLRESVQQGFLKEWEDAVAKGAVSLEEVESKGKEVADATVKEWEDKMGEAISDKAKQMQDEFAGAFDSLTDGFSAIADAFGVDLKGVFDSLGKYLSDETKASITEGIAGALGTDAAGLEAYMGAATTSISAIAGAQDKDKATKSNAGTGGAVGATGGAIIGGAFFGPMGAAIGASIGQVAGELIGGMFKWGSQNPETQARHAFANFVEEGFQKLGQVSFFDAQGKIKNVMGKDFNFVEGSRSRFNDPNWGASMDAWGDKAKSTFLGLGEAMKEVLGITEDVGGQIGFLLGENLAGNIDNARLLVQQLGLTFEEMEEALFQAAKKGNMRWSEFQANVAGISEAFKPGLVAVGDLKGAMDELIGSGGRGVAALKGVRDAAVEAMEKGAHSIEEMGQMMIAQGVDPTLVQDFMEAIRAAGIKTLQDLANASDRTAGAVVANLEGNNEEVRKQWEQMTEDLKELADVIERIPSEKDVHLNVTTSFDENTQKLMNSDVPEKASTETSADKFASGGVVDGATFFRYGGGKLGVAGEAGSEAILPLTRVGGKLGVMAVTSGGKSGNTYIVDARGATPGMESRIKAALRDVEERAVRRSVNAVADSSRRGGRW